jgi:hypothetical protein
MMVAIKRLSAVALNIFYSFYLAFSQQKIKDNEKTTGCFVWMNTKTTGCFIGSNKSYDFITSLLITVPWNGEKVFCCPEIIIFSSNIICLIGVLCYNNI